MKLLARFMLSVLIVAAAAFALHGSVVVPFRCNLRTAEAERRTKSILSAPEVRRASMARENIASMSECMRLCSTDVNAYMLAAANLELLGRWEEAADTYEAALRYHRRPELYLNLGIAQLEVGDRTDALANLVRARVFNQWVDENVPPVVREEVRRRSNELLPDRW